MTNGFTMTFLHPALYWVIIGVLLLLMELALPAFVMFFFGLSALIVALVTWLTHIDIAWQLTLFIVASVVSLLFFRRLFLRLSLFTAVKRGEDQIAEPDDDAMLAVPGERAVVGVSIKPPAEGRISYSGTSWRATADEYIEEGEIVSIVRQDNLVIHVEKI